MNVDQLIAALTIRSENGEGSCDVLARDDHGTWSPVMLLMTVAAQRDGAPSVTVDAWQPSA